MGYDIEQQRVLECVTRDGRIIELTGNRDNQKLYYQELERYNAYQSLAIRYPGYKTTRDKCDYCVCLVDERGEHPISHVEIMYDLYNKTTIENFQQMKDYIDDVAIHGKELSMSHSRLTAFSEGFSFEILTDLMVYIAIQEDINYPMPRWLGRTMCFFRYLEAIYCKVYENHELEEAIRKATKRGGPPAPNWNDVGDLYDTVSQLRRRL